MMNNKLQHGILFLLSVCGVGLMVILAALHQQQEEERASILTTTTRVRVQQQNHTTKTESASSPMPLLPPERNWTEQVKYMVLGIQKGGTTTLCRALREHPLVFNKTEKEKMCFVGKWDPHDPLCRNHHNVKELTKNASLVAGDCSPGYIYKTAQSIPRIKNAFPHVVSFISLLRNPVHRAYSQYNMHAKNNVINKTQTSFDEVVLTELQDMYNAGLLPHWQFPQQLPPETNSMTNLSLEDWQAAVVNTTTFNTFHGSRYERDTYETFVGNRHLATQQTHVSKGLYAIYVRPWLEAFTPRSRFLWIKSEDITADHHADGVQMAINRVYAHLGLSPHTVANVANRNPGHYNFSSMSDDIRILLERLYHPYNQQLASILQDDAWRDPW